MKLLHYKLSILNTQVDGFDSTPALRTFYPWAYFNSFGDLLSLILPIVFNLAGIAVVFYLIIGIFKLITSAGDKNAVASARAMITHAVIGLLLLILVIIFVRYLPNALGLQGYNIL